MLPKNLIATFTNGDFLRIVPFSGDFNSMIEAYQNSTEDCLYVSVQRIPMLKDPGKVQTAYFICDTRTPKAWRSCYTLIETTDAGSESKISVCDATGKTSVNMILHRNPIKISKLIKKLEREYALPSSLFTNHTLHIMYLHGLEYELHNNQGVKET